MIRVFFIYISVILLTFFPTYLPFLAHRIFQSWRLLVPFGRKRFRALVQVQRHDGVMKPAIFFSPFLPLSKRHRRQKRICRVYLRPCTHRPTTFSRPFRLLLQDAVTFVAAVGFHVACHINPSTFFFFLSIWCVSSSSLVIHLFIYLFPFVQKRVYTFVCLNF